MGPIPIAVHLMFSLPALTVADFVRQAIVEVATNKQPNYTL